MGTICAAPGSGAGPGSSTSALPPQTVYNRAFRRRDDVADRFLLVTFDRSGIHQ